MAEGIAILKCKILKHDCVHYETKVDIATNMVHIIMKPLSSDMSCK